MRLTELFQLLIGLFLCLSMECGRSDHVHLKIHVPDVVHKHKHVKTKYVHVYHPKVVHTDHHSSVQYLHSRNDPHVGLSQNSPHNTEYRISEEDFKRWRKEQARKSFEKRQKQQQKQQRHDEEDDYEENIDGEETNYDELIQKHRANKANSAALKKKESAKSHKNHNYAPEHHPTRRPPNGSKKRPNRPAEASSKKYPVYGITNVDAESSNVEQQYSSIDPTAIDPGYYSTLPRDVQNAPQDDIYSGLMSKKFNKNIEDKSRLLADINYSRKQQTKNSLQRRRGQ